MLQEVESVSQYKEHEVSQPGVARVAKYEGGKTHYIRRRGEEHTN
jgi:hypothetical protein